MNLTKEPTTRSRPGLTRAALALLLLASSFFFLSATVSRADDREDEYMAIFDTIQAADAMDSAGKAAPAAAKYQEAQTALLTFQRRYPDWNKKTVTFRLTYVGQKLAAFFEKQAKAANNDGQPASATATASGSSGLKLLQDGAEPRKQLRLHPKPGDKQTMKMSLQIGMDIDMGGAGAPSQSVKVPPILMAFDATVKNISDNGDITYEMVMGDATVADDATGATTPQVAEAMKASLGGIKGMTGTGVVSASGVTKSMDIKMPEGTDPQLKQTLGQMNESFSRASIPFPEAPVGVGARWEVSAPIKSQGMTLQQKATYEIVAIDGDKLTAKTTITQSASNQKIQNPAMGGLKMDLTKMTGDGSGDLTVDLAQLMPSTAKMKMHNEMSMGMNVGAQKQTISMKMDLTLQFECPSGP